jgi:hypothetical protein
MEEDENNIAGEESGEVAPSTSEKHSRAKIVYPIRTDFNDGNPCVYGSEVRAESDSYKGEPVNVRDFDRGVGQASYWGTGINRHGKTRQHENENPDKGLHRQP